VNVEAHWENVFTSKAPTAVSWYRAHLETSLGLIERYAPAKDASIIDVGAGESTLVDDLLAKGYQAITVLDVSRTAIEATKERLGASADRVRWLVGNITEVALPPSAFDLWHDRAAFHFLVERSQREAYVRSVLNAVKRGGHVIVSTFGPEGPTRCSGLEVARYDAASLQAEFGSRFHLEESSEEWHSTPSGAKQQFVYCCFRVD
jgi:2-polyprenyl-3-methyl-5-hydroxy-6-metoxy-1,4-benzoquinol methylase